MRTEDDDRYRVEYLETPIKSENDKKEYRVIRLPNGLTVLLISDVYSKIYVSRDQGKRNEKKAVCSLCVRVGCFNDPPEIPGMANFLKHMVFMGSEKYSQEDDFKRFINEHDGFVRATTDYEYTTFYFAIREEYLLPALDRFAQFFIKPLMKKNSIMRERENIKSEFQLVPCDEEEQLFSSFALTDPANKFTKKKLITFSNNMDDDKLYEKLHKFRHCHYSAHKMKIVIQAKLSLGTLEKYVTTCFADIPSNGLPPDDLKNGISFHTPGVHRMFTKTCFHTSYDMQLTQGDKLEVRWTMPLPSDFYKSKPHKYIAWIIGYEGKGSLTSFLRKKIPSYIVSNDKVQCDSQEFLRHNFIYAVLKLTVMLSPEEQDLQQILDAIFSFINLLKKENLQKRIVQYDIYRMMKNNFRFIDEQDSMNYVINLCENMHFYPSRDYITANKLIYIEYNPEAIQKCLNYLMPETANITIVKKSFYLALDKVNYHLNCSEGTYINIKIPKEWFENWKFIEPFSDFHLPLKNTFITSDFSLIPLPAKVPKYPIKIYNDHISEIWYRSNPKFRSPKCYMNFQFVSSLGIQSPKNAVFIEIYCRVLKLLLLEELYPAVVARFEYQINISEKGIIIEINGFNEKLPILLMTVANYIVNYPALVTEFLFEICKVQLLDKEYHNNTFMDPHNLAEDVKLLILKLIYYTDVDRHTVLSNVNFKEFRRFVKSFTDHLYIQCLVQGNITQDNAIKIIRQFFEIINCGPLTNTVQQMRAIQIPLGISYCKLKNMNKIDTTSVVTNYYQVGIMSIKLSVLIDLLVSIMNKKLYVWIFEEQQLEVFSCDPNYVNGILGYSITIDTQANKCITEDVDQKIETFLKSFNKILQNFSEKELDDVKQELIMSKQYSQYSTDNILKKEIDRNWSEITKEEYVFDRFEREMLAIKNIKINELREWFAKHTVNGSNFRKLSIHVIGNDPKKSAIKKENTDSQNRRKEHFVLEYISDDQETKVYHITNVENYKEDLYVYPLSALNK